MNLGETVDVEEVLKLRAEVCELKAAKLNFEKASENLTKDRDASTERFLTFSPRSPN